MICSPVPQKKVPIYDGIDAAYQNSLVGGCLFSEMVANDLVLLDPATHDLLTGRHRRLLEFLGRALEYFRTMVVSHGASKTSFLVNDSRHFAGLKYYRDLPSTCWHTPRFFRTDEAKSGAIMELQCPGSGWGDLLLLGEVMRPQHPVLLEKFDPAQCVTKAVRHITGADAPSVLHLLDNSSNPASMRFLISRTQAQLRYWGYHPDVSSMECQFIRSHSVQGLMAENLFKERLRLNSEGRAFFDLPPLVVFDQKSTLALPFVDESRDYFTNDDRALFAYTYLLSEKGFRDKDGSWVTLDNFLKRPQKHRRYYLKYAGSDTSLNWGSRAVYRLDSNNAKESISLAMSDVLKGRPWIIQYGVGSREKVRFLRRGENELVEANLPVKYSSFYGPLGLIGVRATYRDAVKVHGQKDAIVALAVRN